NCTRGRTTKACRWRRGQTRLRRATATRTRAVAQAPMTAPRDVLDFWFGAPDSPEYGKPRDLWFRKSDTTDAAIRTRFGADVEAALAGERDGWMAGVRETLALVLLLDQFTRNIFRDTPRAFAGDPQALSLARDLVARGDDRALTPVERWFVYL